jgi:hypothetical protein
MTEQSSDPTTSDKREVAERLLLVRFGGPVRIGHAESVQHRSTVYRLPILDGPPGAPTSVVLKQPPPVQPYDPDAPGFPAPAWYLFNHWAGLQFLNDVAGEGVLVPRCYGADRASGLVIMEHLGGGRALDDILLASDPGVAEAALVDYASYLGHMHAATIGKEHEYDRIRDTLGPHPKDTDYYQYEWLADAFDTTVQLLDITPPPGVRSDLATLVAAVRDPGPFRAFTHGDPCPDNVIVGSTGIKLIDFDVSGYGHALTDGVFGRIFFPGCWCANRIPERVVLRMESVYRTALIPGCPEAADDRQFYQAVVTGCAFWLLDMCHYSPLAAVLDSDEQWGTSTLRQRYLARSGILALAAEQFGHLQALGATFQMIAANLRVRWPADMEDMSYYPAFL